MKKLILNQIVFSLTLILAGCVNQPYGHQSVYSPASINTIASHKLYLIAEKSGHPSLGTGEVTSDKASQYASNHKKTVICDKHHYYAASNVSSDVKQIMITLVSGEEVYVSKSCWVEDSNPQNSIYVSRSSVSHGF
ncbi:hypothetical protein OHW01_18565 [Acinetobacter baumannii]|uniref:hypothetical protein n=1 Tax=Acinetobacter baumannii TaxID=470 RepID=UPI00136055E6|nr:hypothetical protein [Acinetobacter baumannii]MDC4304579.1 hypothetical protein [Acinetobacter baumannii]MDC4563744.1 hypothetical protein [Acinetobacter baumannii]MDC4667797.1 hypothetical protein [Acinetobacter baumannii]MDC4765258.1 hypothetical protein [Acinetobacter baumannii]MDC4861927.1 hypothetical protein [Acinetobacter baumannii]